MVARSYESLKQIGEPYESKGRAYVKVLTKKGVEKEVRWYTEKEYAKMYNLSANEVNTPAEEEVKRNQHDILGFQKGYITIFKGDTYPFLQWFRDSVARYCRWWGWYIVSTDEIPTDLPFGIETVRLAWEKVGREDGSLKNEEEIEAAVEALIYDPGESEFVGEIGERLDLFLTVKRNIPLENNYGHSNMHIMEDDVGDVFIWTTASKSWDENKEYHIRGTVKDHKTYKGVNQTILTRCMEIKK